MSIGRAGVFQGDAPEGTVALVVKNSRGKRLLRVEIDVNEYDGQWVRFLEKWLQRHDDRGLRVVE